LKKAYAEYVKIFGYAEMVKRGLKPLSMLEAQKRGLISGKVNRERD